MARNMDAATAAEIQRMQLAAIRQELPLAEVKQNAYQGLEKAVGVMMDEAKAGRELNFATIMMIIGPAVQNIAAVEADQLGRHVQMMRNTLENADRMVQPIG